VYVDSGSSDGSLEYAQACGAAVVALEPPFTAARARNFGLDRLRAMNPEIPFVQFLDGDCELRPGWLRAGATALARDSGLAVVCGRLRERFPEASIYNRLCDLEWDRPAGPAESSGGIAMMRVAAFAEVKGFRPDLIAGEEPDLCFRLRQCGYRILRLDAEMALHDAAILRFGQWWRRARRSGHTPTPRVPPATATNQAASGSAKADESLFGVWPYPSWPLGSPSLPLASASHYSQAIQHWAGASTVHPAGKAAALPTLASTPNSAFSGRYPKDWAWRSTCCAALPRAPAPSSNTRQQSRRNTIAFIRPQHTGTRQPPSGPSGAQTRLEGRGKQAQSERQVLDEIAPGEPSWLLRQTVQPF
jgi:hypothetical protein